MSPFVTCLEYLEAKKAKIPIRMYVRDLLEADFAIWRSNGGKSGLKLSWCKSEKDWMVFELLEEHRKLSEDGANNWFWVFKDSIELKDLIGRGFKEAFASAAVQALFNSGNLPLVEVEGKLLSYDGESLHFSLHLRNVGLTAAVSPSLEVATTTNSWRLRTLNPKEETTIEAQWRLHRRTRIDLELRLTYSTLQGYKFCDEACLSLWYMVDGAGIERVSYTLKKRRYLGASDAALLMMPLVDGAQPK